MAQKNYTTFVTTGQLAGHAHDPLWVVIDASFDLSKPAWGEENYLKGHIPRAIYAHLDRDLSAPISPVSGRHPLPDPELMAERLSAWGIGPGRQVVVYDTANGAIAARLWWMLQYYGHTAAAILEGGYTKWAAEARPLTAGAEQPHSRFQFMPHPNPDLLIGAEEVDTIRLDPAWKLIDARSAIRFRGEQEPIDRVAGHIPGAVNRFHGENLKPDGTLLSTVELRRQFKALLGSTPIQHTAVYCGSGVTSCLHIAALQKAGFGFPRLYAGSWSEWIRDPDHAVAQDPKV
jgi:thiosulfate/3-mercaptopyruvate sulfurtransferase